MNYSHAYLRSSRLGRFTPLAVIIILVVSGCGGKSAKSFPLDKALAEKSLVQFLDSWKEGKTPADLKNGTPSIVVGEPSWVSGAKLVSYEVVNTDKNDGTNMHAKVKLVVEGEAGEEGTRQVTYIVGTSPVITIFPP